MSPYSRQLSPVCRRLWILIALCLILVVGPGTAATSELPSLGENALFNIERETRLGRSVYDRLKANGLIETDPLLDRYITDLGFRLLAGVDNRVRDYRFFIVRDDAVNAFALPGGFIGVNRGLIWQTRTQHQLASVMAHEIAHVRLRHSMDMIDKSRELSNTALATAIAGLLLGSVDSQVGSALLFGGAAGTQQAMVNFTRENEYEADRIGMNLLQSANFDANGMVEFFQIMTKLSGSSGFGNIEYLRTHPLGTNRVAEAKGRVRELRRGSDQVEDFQLFKEYLLYASSDHLSDQGSDFLRALASARKADYARADTLLGDLYQRDSENVWYSIAYAENLEHLRREREAEVVYRDLLEIFPGDYAISMRLLRLLQLTRQNESALAIARRLENQRPEDPQVYFMLSEIYAALKRPALRMMAEAEFHRINGNHRQAIRLYDQVLKSGDADLATESKAREKRLLLLEK